MDILHLVSNRKRRNALTGDPGPTKGSDGTYLDFMLEPQVGLHISFNKETGRFGLLHGGRPKP